MSAVFISFVHEDQRVAEAVQQYLKTKLNLDEPAFLSSDTWQVFAGERWLERIVAELTVAKVVILMLSKRSIERPWVNFEAGGAWLTEKVIIPACYGNMSKDRLPKPYSSVQALNLPAEKRYLLQSVAHHLQIPPPPGILQEISEMAMHPSGSWGSFQAEYEQTVIETALKTFQDESQ
jgi:hypothetical protein